jgi:hypothetical protein
MISERERLQLYHRLGETLGQQEAVTMMELLPPTSWDNIATTQQLRNLGTELRGEMAELRSELKGEMAELRSELKDEMAELRGDLRSEMARNLKVQVGANFAAMLTLSAFIVTLS